ncbi:protein of unknown function (DUF885 family) [Sporomusaceae bacterium BoRhaA]|uniref:hypothetical protein n=1 Tax=Pelorhabdus rhamnosifermentans TaxID=2772457 RepID=UPI001C063646|nr:hypothetical protein [Pelorhabdus rhamnosifermentans]MBU2704192.1 protein of unknown function (DUF885 family) [Pelorhabdus rhamnosifermentans]
MDGEKLLSQIVDELMQLGEEKFFKTIFMLNAITEKAKGQADENADLRAKLESLQQVIDSQKETNLVLVNKLEAQNKQFKSLEANSIKTIRKLQDELKRGERDDARQQVERLQQVIANLALTNENDREGLQAQVALLRGALEKYNDLMRMSEMAAQYGGKLEDKLKFASRRDAIAAEMVKALDTTPVEAAERVQGLVDALEKAISSFIETDTDDNGFVDKFEQATCSLLEEALAKYRGESEAPK